MSFLISCYLMFLVGDADSAGRAAGAGLAAVVGIAPGAPEATCNDLINAISCTNWSSLTCPWKVGMIGPNPATSCACGFRIDVRM